MTPFKIPVRFAKKFDVSLRNLRVKKVGKRDDEFKEDDFGEGREKKSYLRGECV